MRLVFAGTPSFADVALRALIAAGHEVKLVLTQPDRPAGRGRKLMASPVKRTAMEYDIPCDQPEKLRDPATWASVQAAAADVMVVAAYGLILPAGLLAVPRLGCMNIHASLLPRWRGAAPIQRAIEAGDSRTGVTIMQMDAGLDTGPIRLMRPLEIGAEETGGSLHDRMAALGGEAIVAALGALADGTLGLEAQPDVGVTYADKILPAERALDWSQPAAVLHDKIRAFDPVPGCTARLQSLPEYGLKIWASRVNAAGAQPGGPPGTVVRANASEVVVATGSGALSIVEIQRPGGRRMPIAAFQQGQAIREDDVFV